MERATPALQKIVVDILHRAPPEEMPMLAWPLVCGRSVAGKTRALDCIAGVLRVEVPDVTWRGQLVGLVPQYLHALERMIGPKVQRIDFVLKARGGKQ
ncbi:MAG TPA: DciA family protein [Terriglobales bacterium]|nr:DciA family protein [Terriglobales bacterium]